jgi:hypothetical protein
VNTSGSDGGGAGESVPRSSGRPLVPDRYFLCLHAAVRAHANAARCRRRQLPEAHSSMPVVDSAPPPPGDPLRNIFRVTSAGWAEPGTTPKGSVESVGSR